jgi:exopolysaccharide biosynthesis polyprenyl glycosylphosphotransferase
MLDIALASVALTVLAPIMLVVAACVYLGDRAPVLYGQTRLGEGGRPFKILKFRTMVVDAEKQGRAIWAEADDPRVTRVGRFLRKARLDEVPQLWNVLRGDMSIVGPRPERPEFVELLAEHVPFWTRRHLVKPGITGWAQVRHRYTSDVPGTTEKLSYDLYYLKHRSLFLDLAIVAKTAKTVFSGSGAI